jgi:hypothetical protein
MKHHGAHGRPGDMNAWRETLRDPNVTFPCESSQYRDARKQLLEAEHNCGD